MATSLRLLLIEDSENDALLLELELRRGGHDVRPHRVQTAAEMQTALTTQTWDAVISDVDAWDDLRSNRPYSLGWPEEKMQAYPLAESGRHFDPDVVSGFMSLDLARVRPAEASD